MTDVNDFERAKLISITPNAEELIGYCARVSNPKNQDNKDVSGLLAYCLKHGHVSVFEQAYMTIEITTTRSIANQMIRHKSCNFQQFSLRYAEAETIEFPNQRKQDTKNRQNSTNDLTEEDVDWFNNEWYELESKTLDLYRDCLDRGFAKETAREILPLCTQTRLYMSATIRSWIHYLQVRTDESTQLEHREVALACKKIFDEQLPIISESLNRLEIEKKTERVSRTQVVKLLNEALEADNKAMAELISSRVSCNEELASHKTISVTQDCRIGILGILNGLFSDNNFIMAEYADNGIGIARFVLKDELS